jgi:hypothetical protein
MFGQGRERTGRIEYLVQTFRAKGATSPERAMTAQELGLPLKFEQALKRRLGRTGIFVDVGGKYYLNEQLLAVIQKSYRGTQRAGGRRSGWRRNMLALRISRLILGGIIFVLLVINLLSRRSNLLWILIIALVAIWIAITIYQLTFLTRLRKRLREHSDFSSAAPRGST